MIDRFLALASEKTSEAQLRSEVAEHVRTLLATAGRGDARQVARAEADVQAAPNNAFTFDDSGLATLEAGGGTWQAGRFATPTIGELRRQAAAKPGGQPVRLWVLDGASPATDIGGLQATVAAGALFQVASQFNCLEAPSPKIVSVAAYFHDPTQGPRASISAFPATLLRHYSAPGADAKRFVQQTSGRQIDLLVDVFAQRESPVGNGYLMYPGLLSAAGLVATLEAGFDRIRVGVHDEAQVVLGYDWNGSVEDTDRRRITQVFTSTVAGGLYGAQRILGADFEPACRQTLRAAYLGTLLAAVALGRRIAVLTLIGGGVFGNPARVIWESILWAFDEVRSLASVSLDVVLNGYNLSALIDLGEVLPGVRDRGGAILRFGREGLLEVRR
jgi:hypothetical protein